jgi:hypothetical protein
VLVPTVTEAEMGPGGVPPSFWLPGVEALRSGKGEGVALLDSRLVNEARITGSMSSLLGFRLIHGTDVSALAFRFSSNFLLSSHSTVTLVAVSCSCFSSSSLASIAARWSSWSWWVSASMRSFSIFFTSSFSSRLCLGIFADEISEVSWFVGKSDRGEADKVDVGSNVVGLSEESKAKVLVCIVEVAGSSLGPGLASGRGLEGGGAGLGIDWRLDMKLGFGVTGGGGTTLPVTDPLRDEAFKTGASEA